MQPDLPEGEYIVESFQSFDAWSAWIDANPLAQDAEHIRSIVDEALRNGIDGAFLGAVPPWEVSCDGSNYRETLLARGLNARQRAVLDLFSTLPVGRDPKAKVYATEAITPFALAMRGRYPWFIGSECCTSEQQKSDLFPIQHQDLSRLTFPDASFRAVIAKEAFEHLPDLDAALREIARVLLPGGILLATFPFAYWTQTTEIRARIEDGAVQHTQTPEYHDDPMDPEGGLLVFQMPSWDIIPQAAEAGFSSAEFLYISSVTAGITGADLAGIMIFTATR